MVYCELDNRVSGSELGWPLPAWQALLLHRFLPSCGGLVVYITLVCFDLALLVEHFQNGSTMVGTFCVILFITPALGALVFTLATPPPGLRTEDSAVAVTIARDDFWWILQQIINFFAFPIAAICRYCHQIFWTMEAVCAAHANDSARAQDALQRVRAPSPQELYLFLQAFLHAAPHALINIIDMLYHKEMPSFDKVSVQSVSIVVSIMRMASTATVYRRFEREKLNGIKYPWSLENESLLENEEEGHQTTPNQDTVDVAEVIAANTDSEDRRRSQQSPGQSRYTIMNNLNSSYPKELDKSYSFIDNLTRRLSFSSSDSEDYLKPVTPSTEKIHRENSYEEAVRKKSMIDSVAPRRDPNVYNIEEVHVPPPPAFQAPRPMSLTAWAEKIVENAEHFPEMISAPQRRRYVPEIIRTAEALSKDTTDHVPLPVAIPRTAMRGLEPQDASAAIVHYFSWYLFFIARLLSIGTFVHFHPVAGIIIIMCHYQLMLLLLIVPQATAVRRAFYVFLAFVYIFCLLEFKVRFRHVRVWHVFWLILCTVETVVFAGVWGTLGGQGVNWWWQTFMLFVIFGSLILSYMCMLVYFVLLKPNETVVYLNNNSNSPN